MKIILITIAIALLALIFIALFFSPSILYKHKDRTCLDPADCLTVVFNPLRSRASENSADSFLQLLKDKKCNEVRTSFALQNSLNCDRENSHPLMTWELVDREDIQQKTILHFKAYRADYPQNGYSNLWVTLVKENQKWKVTDFECWY